MTTTNVKPSQIIYDHYSREQYDQDIVRSIPGYHELHGAISDFLNTQFDSGQNIKLLDLGVGTGNTSKLIMDLFPRSRVDAVEFSSNLLNRTREKLGDRRVHYLLGDYATMEFEHTYDLVVSVISLHHQSTQGKQQMFEKIYNCLKPGGVFIFGDLVTFRDPVKAAYHNALHYHHLVVQYGSDHGSLKAWAYHHQYLNDLAPVEDQREWLQKLGFEVEQKYLQFKTSLMVAKKSSPVRQHPLPSVVGTDATGQQQRVIKLNNAATTPPFQETLQAVNRFLQSYGALHRGAGPHANQTHKQVTRAVQTVRSFFNLRDDQALLFSHNTSSAINVLARLLNLQSDDVVITSSIEHTSNNLPWRYNSRARVVEVPAGRDGSMDLDRLTQLAEEHRQHLKVLTFTGASNQTGYIPPIRQLSDLAHRYGAMLFIDAAQLAPHRPIDVQQLGIDAMACSAHKMYAPFGLGVLVLPKTLLDQVPVDPGGGSIDMISDADIVWAPSADRHHVGTWNVTGLVALAASCDVIRRTGWENILRHERELTHYAAQQLVQVPGLRLWVAPKQYANEDRIGTFPFTLGKYHHALVSAVLDHEFGIETRAGTICNHRLVRRWFQVSDDEQRRIEQEIKAGNRLSSYGIVRASLGIHNTKEDIDALVSALKSISVAGPQFKYRPLPEAETFEPVNGQFKPIDKSLPSAMLIA